MWLVQSKEEEKEMQQRGDGDPDRVSLEATVAIAEPRH